MHSNFQLMSAMLTSSDLNHDNVWYSDSGATHHLTHFFSNEFGGGNKVDLGNETGLPILNHGFTFPFHLLYIPIDYFI